MRHVGFIYVHASCTPTAFCSSRYAVDPGNANVIFGYVDWSVEQVSDLTEPASNAVPRRSGKTDRKDMADTAMRNGEAKDGNDPQKVSLKV